MPATEQRDWPVYAALVAFMKIIERVQGFLHVLIFPHKKGVEAATRHVEQLVTQNITNCAYFTFIAEIQAQLARTGKRPAVLEYRKTQRDDVQLCQGLSQLGRKLVAVKPYTDTPLMRCECVLALDPEHRLVVSVEDNGIACGCGSALLQLLNAERVDTPVRLTLHYTTDHYGAVTEREFEELRAQLNSTGLFEVSIEGIPWEKYRPAAGRGAAASSCCRWLCTQVM